VTVAESDDDLIAGLRADLAVLLEEIGRLGSAKSSAYSVDVRRKLVKDCADLRARIAKLDVRRDPWSDMTPAELVAEMRMVLQSWPDQMLEAAVHTYAERHRCVIWAMGETGSTRAWWDVDEGRWVAEHQVDDTWSPVGDA
jgi:hypothetical protein